jgi:hypothetical protein
MTSSPFSLKKKKKSVYPNQNICEERANGVICNGNFYPYQTWAMATGDLTTKPKIQFYVKSVMLFLYVQATDIGTLCTIQATKTGFSTYTLLKFEFPSATLCGFMYGERNLGILLPEGYTVLMAIDAALAKKNGLIVYAEIDTLPGEKNPYEVES